MVLVISLFSLGALKDKAMHVGKLSVRSSDRIKLAISFWLERGPRPTHQVIVIGGIDKNTFAARQCNDLVGCVRWLGNLMPWQRLKGHVLTSHENLLPGHFISFCFVRSTLIAFLLFALTLSAQVKQLGPVKVAGASKQTFGAASPAPTYTGQNCTGGGVAGLTTSTCTATITVTTGDQVVVFSTQGSPSVTLSSCSTATGTATVTWTVKSDGTTGHDATNNETLGSCVGNVTNGGTVEPRATWSNTGNDDSIVAAGYSGSASHATDGQVNQVNAGSSSANANTSGTITTTTNNDVLVGGVADTAGAAATISAGTTSATFTKRVCTTVWGGQTCIEDGPQTTAGAGTTAAWTFSNADRNIAGLVAVKP